MKYFNNIINNLIDENLFIEIPYIIATKKAAPLTIGTGLIFDCETTEIQDFINDWYSKKQVYIKLWQFAVFNSLYGRAIMYLNHTQDGGLDLVLLKQITSARVAKLNEIENVAKIYTTPYEDDNNRFFEIDMVQGKTTIKQYVLQEGQSIADLNGGIPKGMQVVNETFFDTGIDILPIIETTNLPNPSQANVTVKMFPDTIAVRQLIADVQANIKAKRTERQVNITRFYGVGTPEQIKSFANDPDFNNVVKSGYISNGMQGYEKGVNGGIEVMQGDPKFDQYVLDMNNTMKLIFEGSGYNYTDNSNDGYENKTSSIMGQALDVQTTKIKQQYYLDKMYRLFDYVMIFYGKWDGKGVRPYSMWFKDAHIVDELKMDEYINSRLANQTMSRIEAISRYDQIPENQAIEKLKEIEEDVKAMGELNNSLDPEFNSDSGSLENGSDMKDEVI